MYYLVIWKSFFCNFKEIGLIVPQMEGFFARTGLMVDCWRTRSRVQLFEGGGRGARRRRGGARRALPPPL